MSKKPRKRQKLDMVHDDVLTASLGLDTTEKGKEEEEENSDAVREGQEEEEETQEEEVETPETEEVVKETPAETEEPKEVEEPEKSTEAPKEPEAVKEPPKRSREDLERENKAIRDELTELRRKNRDLQGQQTRFQAPPPVMPQPAAPQPPSDELFEIQFTEEGKTGIPKTPLQRMIAQEVAAATRVSPEEQFRQALEQQSSQWIAVNTEERLPIAEYVRNAAEFLQEHTKYHHLSTGQSSETVSGWLNIMEQSGIADKFRERFGEIPDLWEFTTAFFGYPNMPIEDRINGIRHYMDSYVDTRSKLGVGRVTEPTRGQESSGGVIPLIAKPRSMAKKGTGAPAKTPALSRLAALRKKAAVETVDMTKAEWDEMRQLEDQEEGAA